MSSFLANEAGKVEFFGMTTATPEFLLKYGISYAGKGNSLDVIVEVDQNGKPLLYLLEASAQQLRVVTLAELDKRYTHLVGKATSAQNKALAVLDDEDSSSELGKLLYLAHYEDTDNRSALIGSAYDAAKDSGVTHQTARWFAQYFVQDAFFGYGFDQEFTDQGVFRGPEAFDCSHATVNKQLRQLQQAGLMSYEALPKQAGFHLKFNRQALPGIVHSELPQFFTVLLF